MVAALAKKVAGRPKFSLNIPPRELVPLHVARSAPPAPIVPAPAAAASTRQHCRTLSVSSICSNTTSAPVSARSQNASPFRSAGRAFHQQQQRQAPSQPAQQALPFRASLVCPRLYVGNAVDAAALPALRAHNIHYVLNVAAECGDAPAALEADGIRVLHVPLRDTADAASDALREFPRICQFIDAGMRDPRGGAVLIHCLYGVSRSATAALAYMLAAASAASTTHSRAAPTSTSTATSSSAAGFCALPKSPVQPLATSAMDAPAPVALDDASARDISKVSGSSGSSEGVSRDGGSAEAAVYAALHAMQAARPDVQPNDGFIGALIEWSAYCSHAQSRL